MVNLRPTLRSFIWTLTPLRVLLLLLVTGWLLPLPAHAQVGDSPKDLEALLGPPVRKHAIYYPKQSKFIDAPGETYLTEDLAIHVRYTAGRVSGAHYQLRNGGEFTPKTIALILALNAPIKGWSSGALGPALGAGLPNGSVLIPHRTKPIVAQIRVHDRRWDTVEVSNVTQFNADTRQELKTEMKMRELMERGR